MNVVGNISLYEEFMGLYDSIRYLKIKKTHTDSIKEFNKLSSEITNIQKKMDVTMRKLVRNFTDFAHENKQKYSYPRQYDLCSYKTNRFISFNSAVPKIKPKCGSLVAKMTRDCGEGYYEDCFLVIPKDYILNPERYIHRIEYDTITTKIVSCKNQIKDLVTKKTENEETLKKHEDELKHLANLLQLN